MSVFEKLMHMIGDRRVPVPSVPSLPRYRISFANGHVMKIIMMVILVSAAAVVFAMIFAIKGVVSATYNWPEPATYDVTRDGLQTMGTKNPKYEDGSESHTLSIRLGDGSRISTLRIKDTDAGQLNLARSLDVRPYTTAVTGAQAYLHIGTLTIENSSFPKFEMQNSEVGTMNTGMLCDGHSQETVITNTIPDLEMKSERGASVYEASETVDRVQIMIMGNKGAVVDNLIISNFQAWSGMAFFERVKVGTLNVGNSVRVGSGSGIDNPDCLIGTEVAVKARIVNSTIQDRPIHVR